jgi:hypothetical protein
MTTKAGRAAYGVKVEEVLNRWATDRGDVRRVDLPTLGLAYVRPGIEGGADLDRGYLLVTPIDPRADRDEL